MSTDSQYILIVQCPDTKGVVAAVSGYLADNDASIVESNHLNERAVERVSHAHTPAALEQIGRIDVVAPIGYEKRKHRESIEHLRSRFRTREASQQLLEHEARRQDNRLAGLERPEERSNLWSRSGRIASKRQ